MKKVKIRTLELLSVVRENRETHVADYEEAMTGWRSAIRDAVADARAELADLQAGIDDAPFTEVPEGITFFHITKPTSHEKDYDQVIRMLAMSADEYVELEHDEFARYVMDDWHWKHEFRSTTNEYKARK